MSSLSISFLGTLSTPPLDPQFFLFMKAVSAYYNGEAFDNQKPYTLEEKKLLNEDIKFIYETRMAQQLNSYKQAILTAGAPGAGKAEIIQEELYAKNLAGIHFVYLCPDNICLPLMVKTFLQELTDALAEVEKSSLPPKEKAEKELLIRKEEYNKWRPASNAAALLNLIEVVFQNISFYYGTSSTDPLTGAFFQFFKTKGYSVRLIHVIATEEVRREVIKRRSDKSLTQETEKDIVEKGFLLPQRINDFLTNCDEIDFFFRFNPIEKPCCTSTWLKGQPNEKGLLIIMDKERYKEMVEIHDSICDKLQRNDIKWANTVLKASKIFVR